MTFALLVFQPGQYTNAVCRKGCTMGHHAPHTCPVWIGHFLLNPFRKIVENPNRIFAPFVKQGMTILEPGPGMGFFTLPLANMVGSNGKVVAIDVQQRMLDTLRRRAHAVGLEDRLDVRLSTAIDLCAKDLQEQVDFVPAIHVVHEVPDAHLFFSQVFSCLKKYGTMLMIEPRFHVSAKDFGKTVDLALSLGFEVVEDKAKAVTLLGGRQVALKKA